MAPKAAKTQPNKQTHLIWWVFLSSLFVYGFEVILVSQSNSRIGQKIIKNNSERTYYNCYTFTNS